MDTKIRYFLVSLMVVMLVAMISVFVVFTAKAVSAEYSILPNDAVSIAQIENSSSSKI
ncbi:MAG: hypothetical protein K5923_01670 [Clostridia bacterium]|nr:hypothetical protein [Clostridia bacterium]